MFDFLVAVAVCLAVFFTVWSLVKELLAKATERPKPNKPEEKPRVPADFPNDSLSQALYGDQDQKGTPSSPDEM